MIDPGFRSSRGTKKAEAAERMPLNPEDQQRNHKLSRIALAALALTLATGGTILALHRPFSQSRVTQSLQETFPATVTFQKFHSTYFPHPGCIGEGVIFKQLGRPAGTAPIATIQHLTIEAHYIDLLLRPGYLAHILLDGFRVSVPPAGTPLQETGWKALKSSLRIGEIIADGATLQIARADDSPPLLFDIHKLKLSSVSESNPMSYEVAMHNPLPPGEIRSYGHFGPWNSGDPGETPVDGYYSLRNADLSVFDGIAGLLSSEDEFRGNLGHIESRAKIDVPDFMVTRSKHSIHLTSDSQASINGINGDVQLERVNASFLNTQVVANGQIASQTGPHGKTASIDLTVHKGRIHDVLWIFVKGAKPPLIGTTSFRTHIVLPPGKRPFLQKVRLTGDFGIDSGQFTKTSTQKDVDILSERSRGAKPDADADEEDLDRAISDLAGHVELQNATATFDNLSFNVPGASASMHGTYNLETEIVDLHGALKTDAELSNMTTGLKSVLIKPFNALFKRRHAGALVSVHLTGTYSAPHAGIDLPAKKPPTTQNNSSN